jgi:hypothetical protein
MTSARSLPELYGTEDGSGGASSKPIDDPPCPGQAVGAHLPRSSA